MFGADGDWRGTSRRFLHKGVFENLVPRFFLPPYDRVLTHRACIHPISEIFGEALAAELTASMLAKPSEGFKRGVGVGYPSPSGEIE